MSPRLRKILPFVVALVAVAAFYKLALAPKKQQATELQAQIEQSEARLLATQEQIRTLESAKAAYATDYSTLARLGKAVPADDDVRSLLVQLNTAAKRSRIDFESLTLSGGGGGGGGGAPAAGSASAPATQAAAATLPPGASVGASGLPTMPLLLNFKGSFFHMAEFLARLERFVITRGDRLEVKGRLLTIDGFSLAPSAAGFKEVSATVGATGYLVNPSEGASRGATASGPAGAAAPAGKPASKFPAAPLATAPTAGSGP